jgi:hypothetical protein
MITGIPALLSRPLRAGSTQASLPYRAEPPAQLTALWDKVARVVPAPLQSSSLASAEQATLQTLKPALTLLSGERRTGLLRWLLTDWPYHSEADLRQGLKERWDTGGQNDVLVTLSAACRAGIFFQRDGYWQQTVFGASFANSWRKGTPREMFEAHWGGQLCAEYLDAVRWAWFALAEEPGPRNVFNALVDAPTGISHDELPIPSGVDGRHQALRGVAAAAAIGGAWFNGWRWEPTLIGAWLSRHPESYLSAPRE